MMGFLRRIGSAIVYFARQCVRVFLLPFGFFLKGSGAWDWANRDEPTDPKEKAILRRTRIFRYLSLLSLISLASLMILVFGWPFERAGSSFRYLWQSIQFTFGNWTAAEELSPPDISNATMEQFDGILANIKNFWYYLQLWIGCLTNPDIAKEWGHEFLEWITNVLRFLTWIPVGILAFYLLTSSITAPHPGEDISKSAILSWWDERFVPTIFRPVRDFILDFLDYFRDSKWVKWTFWISFGVLCLWGWTAFDVIVSYLLMIFTFDFGWFPTFAASAFVDVVVFFVRIGAVGTAAVILFLLFKAIKKAAVSKIMQMQAINEEVAESLPVITAINGAVGTGKTTMMSSIAYDGDSLTRDYYLSRMKTYAAAFNAFPWRKLELWVIAQQKVKDERNRLNTRAKIRRVILDLYKRWKDAHFAYCMEDGSEYFFGYDPEFGIEWDNGAEVVSLAHAAATYAECYFMYHFGLKLVTSNYPIGFKNGHGGDFFPVFEPAGSFITKPDDAENVAYSGVLNMDFFRILRQMDPSDDGRLASIDGGFIAMTEASNERGNRFDYVGKKKTDGEANPLNDGHNQFMRITRHPFTVDGKPTVKVIYDYQRGDSMNAEGKDSAEDTILIMQRGDEDNALALWGVTETVCLFFETWWTNFYWYTWRPNRGKETLLTRFLGRICGFFINVRQKLRYRYGYETIVFNREHGGMNGLTGKRTMEQYFVIYKKTRGGLFNTAVYGPVVETSSLAAKNGWAEAPRFSSINGNWEEFKEQHSYFFEKLAGTYADLSKGKPAERLKAAQTRGTDTPFQEGDTDTPFPEGEEDPPDDD